jgi:phosphoglucosamine mutase
VLTTAAGFETYVSHLSGPRRTGFDGIKVVIDCANGAASLTAPETLRRLGAEVDHDRFQPGRAEHHT